MKCYGSAYWDENYAPPEVAEPARHVARWLVPATILLCVLLLWALPGCAALNPRPPVEALAEKIVDEGIVPGIRQGLAQGLQAMTVQAGAQAIDPTYVVEIEGLWVTGIRATVTVGVKGLAGQIQVATVSSPATQPAK